MRVVTLIACMHKPDYTIVNESNVQTDVIVINQCNENRYEETVFLDRNNKEHKLYFVSTTSRGLSKSRNQAINFAQKEKYDICLICDDDELLADNYDQCIKNAYDAMQKADIITFSIDWSERHKASPTYRKRMSLVNILQTSSQQITFKLSAILDKNILFDEKMGSGSGNGGSEEIKFLMDSKRKGLSLYYEPNEIAVIKPGGESQWFKGYTLKYLENLAWSDRRALGSVLGYAYMWIYCFTHYKLYKDKYSLFEMISSAHRGYFEKR